MNEHEDDIEPEVEEGVDFEVEEFPVLGEDEAVDVDGNENEEADAEPDIDPDASEL